MTLYMFSAGEWSNWDAVGLFEGPDGADPKALVEEMVRGGTLVSHYWRGEAVRTIDGEVLSTDLNSLAGVETVTAWLARKPGWKKLDYRDIHSDEFPDPVAVAREMGLPSEAKPEEDDSP